MEWALQGQELYEVVTGAEVNAAKDVKAKALIGTYVANHFVFTVDKATSAKEAWDALKNLYAQTSMAKWHGSLEKATEKHDAGIKSCQEHPPQPNLFWPKLNTQLWT